MKCKRIAGAVTIAVLLITGSAMPVLANAEAPEDNVVAVGSTDVSQSASSNEDAGTGATTENALTPDGNGNLVDDATTADDKEFYTVQTDNGDWFYIVIDKQKDSDNVYLLNNVTDADLAALAERDAGTSASVASQARTSDNSADDLFNTSGDANDQTTDIVSTETQEEAPTETTETSAAVGGLSSDMILIIMVVVVFAGGGLYAYFKIIRPKKNGYSEEYEDDEDFEENEEHEGGDDEEIESQLDPTGSDATNDDREDHDDLQRR